MAGKYSWHPQRPPSPPATPIASKIASIGPIAKCLEEALSELREEDRREMDPSDGSDARHSDDSGKRIGIANRKDAIDEEISNSILKGYAHCVATTTCDHRKKNDIQSVAVYNTTSAQQSLCTSNNTTAPAALLKGEIQYFNRIGGQWRVIVKNTTLIPRQTKVDVRKSGRKRLMLDWNANDTDDHSENEQDADRSARKKAKGEDEYHLKGAVEILAYNDVT